MTYEEFLRNWFDEKNDSDASWKEGWEEHNIYPNGQDRWKDEIGNPLAFPDGMPVYDYCLERESESAQVIVMLSLDGDSGMMEIEWIRVFIFDYESVSEDVTNEEIGTIGAVDALLGTGLDAASKKAEELKKRKLVTVANLQKALEDYDERKGTAVENGAPVEGKNKVFIDGDGRVYAKYIQLARQSGLNVEKSERQSADRDLSAEIAKKADKEHTHKAADITDLPNYARSVNGEEPDADGNVEIDIDAVVEVAELPGETKKKVYLVPEVTTVKTEVDCSSVKSILSAAADYVSGVKGHSINSLSEWFNFVKNSEGAKEGFRSFPSHGGEAYVIDIPEGITVNGKSSSSHLSCEWWEGKQGEVICEKNRDSVVATVKDLDYAQMFKASVGGFEISELFHSSEFQGSVGKSGLYYIYQPLTLPTSMYFGEDSRTPPAVYAESVELATKEALSEATSGADEKAAALGERIGAVESSVTTAKSDITAMKSNITEAQANITKAQGDIEAVAAEMSTVKTDVAALETKAVRSVNGTEPDENGNVEVAAASDASDKNDTITVSDTDSAVSDDTGILSGESGENPKGLLRFAASKIWDYVQGKLNTVLGIKGKSGRTEFLKRFMYSGQTVSFPIVREGELNFFGDENCHATVEEVFDSSLLSADYILYFGLAYPYPNYVKSVKVLEQKSTGFKVDIETLAEGDDTYLSYIAVAFL